MCIYEYCINILNKKIHHCLWFNPCNLVYGLKWSFLGWINLASPLFLPQPLLPSLQCFYVQWLNRWITRSTAPQRTRGSLCPITSVWRKKKCKKQESRVYLSVKITFWCARAASSSHVLEYIKTSLTLPFSQIQITVLFKSPAISPHKCFSLIAFFVYGSTHCLARRAQMSSAPSPDWECLPKIDTLDTHKEHLSADRLASLNCTSTDAFTALRPFRESNNLWRSKYVFWCWTYWKDQMIFACRIQ